MALEPRAPHDTRSGRRRVPRGLRLRATVAVADHPAVALMQACGLAVGLVLAVLVSAATAAERLADPTRAFVEGYAPSQNYFYANTPERTVLLRIRDDFDGDGIGDLALSDSSTWGNAGGQWLLFRGQRDGAYVYWGTLFFSPGTLAIGPRPGDVTAWVRVVASLGTLQVHRLGSETITLELEHPSDRAAYEAALSAGRRPAVEHCKLLAYRQDPAGCWRPGLGL